MQPHAPAFMPPAPTLAPDSELTARLVKLGIPAGVARSPIEPGVVLVKIHEDDLRRITSFIKGRPKAWGVR